MRSVSIIALLVALGCSGSEDKSPGPGDGSGERPSEPGTTVSVEPSGEIATQVAALEQALGAVESTTASELESQHALAHGSLGYDPSTAAGLDVIQGSALALTASELDRLNQHGFVISTGQEFPTFAYGYETIYGADLPLYVSADSILEALHRSYDDILKAIEVASLIPEMGALLDELRENLAGAGGLSDGTRKDVDFYLAVAKSLLSGSAAAPVAGADSDQIASFLASATAASGLENVKIFGVGREVDFSQFTPRGHYTDSEELERYFRAMMWLGRIDFRLIETQSNHERVFYRGQFDAMVAIESLFGEAQLGRFERIDTTIEAFVGQSDYMTLPEVGALLSDLGVDGPAGASALDDETIAKAIVAGGYGTQQIASHFMINGVPENGTLPLNTSFAVLGQRYVLDSHVFSNVVYDRAGNGSILRMMPDPLDVAFAALGNDQAIELLAPELEQYPYAPDLAAMRVLADAHGAGFWDANLYNRWLGSLRALSPSGEEVADPAAAGLPSITGTEAWGRRLLNTQLASWAELRHDTILYAKQSYTGGISCEFPDAYVDPYPELYARLVAFAEEGARVAGVALDGVSPDLSQRVTDYFAHLGEVAGMLQTLAESQRAGTPFSDEQMAFINDAVVLQVEGCGWPTRTTGWYGRLYFDPYVAADFDPTIADVHTQPTDEAGTVVGRVLHVGTGRPRLMVVTADTCTGPHAYVGLASAYFETITEDFERLTDEEWSQRLFNAPPAEVEWVSDLLAAP